MKSECYEKIAFMTVGVIWYLVARALGFKLEPFFKSSNLCQLLTKAESNDFQIKVNIFKNFSFILKTFH